MLPDAAATTPLVPLTFARRAEPAELPELMDQPCEYEEFRKCLHDLASVNRLMRAYAPTLNFLDRVAASHDVARPLRILDVGFGGGDTLRAIAHWAAEHNIIVELKGVDLNPYSARAAREFGANDPLAANIDLITADVFRYQPDQKPDVILSSLFTHHLSSSEVVRFLPIVFGWHRFVRHDGPVSLQRAFREDDWHRLLAKAEIVDASVESHAMCRLCVARVRSVTP